VFITCLCSSSRTFWIRVLCVGPGAPHCECESNFLRWRRHRPRPQFSRKRAILRRSCAEWSVKSTSLRASTCRHARPPGPSHYPLLSLHHDSTHGAFFCLSHAYVSRRPSKTVTFCVVGRDIWANRRVAVLSAESTAFARQIACSLHPPRRARAPKPRAAVRQQQERQQGERPLLRVPPQPRPLAVPRSKSPLVWSPDNASGEEMLKSSFSSRQLVLNCVLVDSMHSCHCVLRASLSLSPSLSLSELPVPPTPELQAYCVYDVRPHR